MYIHALTLSLCEISLVLLASIRLCAGANVDVLLLHHAEWRRS